MVSVGMLDVGPTADHHEMGWQRKFEALKLKASGNPKP